MVKGSWGWVIVRSLPRRNENAAHPRYTVSVSDVRSLPRRNENIPVCVLCPAWVRVRSLPRRNENYDTQREAYFFILSEAYLEGMKTRCRRKVPGYRPALSEAYLEGMKTTYPRGSSQRRSRSEAYLEGMKTRSG